MVVALIAGCDTVLTETPPAGDVFDGPLDGLPPELLAAFARGDENFAKVFTPATGLGPLFNQAGCESCHPGDGRGTVAQSLIRFSRGGDPIVGEGGPQLQDRAIAGAVPETLPPGVETSRRLPPPVFGVGLIEAIPAQTILALADSADSNGDGISGRVNWVSAAGFVPATEIGGGPGLHIGRFGRKAGVSSILEQVVAAYQQDVGITSDFLPEEPGSSVGDRIADPEIPGTIVNDTAMYVRLLAPPARGAQTTQVKRGEARFMDIGCASCHVPSLQTGPHAIAALSNRSVNLYSDLLVHDMGPELADYRTDGSASGTEWRTTPLWGTRLVQEFLGGRAFFLHDGRASTLDQAIRLHGGEASAARAAYLALSADDRAALVAFLESL